MKPRTDITNLDMAFGSRALEFMPPMSEIPKDYPGRPAFEALQVRWFFEGMRISELPPVKRGIDLKAAIRHLQLIQTSFEPKHEHKKAAVAWLMSQWFEEPKR